MRKITGHNTGWATVAVQCSANTFVVKIANFVEPKTMNKFAAQQQRTTWGRAIVA